jgi:hypothetical protein
MLLVLAPRPLIAAVNTCTQLSYGGMFYKDWFHRNRVSSRYTVRQSELLVARHWTEAACRITRMRSPATSRGLGYWLVPPLGAVGIVVSEVVAGAPVSS